MAPLTTQITVHGTAGNGLGQYLNGSTIEVFGNAQEAVGDTMNAGEIVVHGNVGDACGYAMRGGKIYIKGDCGYRAGIHMKAYQQQHFPLAVVGGKAGSFLGEYLSGGLILCSASVRTARIRSAEFLRNRYARRQNCVKM